MRNIYYNKKNGGIISRTLFPEKNECQFVVITQQLYGDKVTVETVSNEYSFNVDTVKTIDIYYDYDAKYDESSIYLRQGIGTETCPLGRNDFLNYRTLSEWICELKAVCSCSNAYLRIFCKGSIPASSSFARLSQDAIITSWNNSDKIVFDVDPLETLESSAKSYHLHAFIVDANIEIKDDIYLEVAGIFNCTVLVGQHGELEVDYMCDCTIESVHNGSESGFEIYNGQAFKNVTCIGAVKSINVWWAHTVNISAASVSAYHVYNSTIHIDDTYTNHTICDDGIWRDVTFYHECNYFYYAIIHGLSAKNCRFICNYTILGDAGNLFNYCYLQDCDISLNVDGHIDYSSWVSGHFAMFRCCIGGEITDCKIKINGDIHFLEKEGDSSPSYTAFCYCFDEATYENCDVSMDISITAPPYDASKHYAYDKVIKICDDRQNNSTCHTCIHTSNNGSTWETINDCSKIDS